MHTTDANIFAQLVLLLWPVVCAVLFATQKPHIAASIIAVVGHLYLPERLAFDAPLIPPLDKDTITALCIYAGALAVGPPQSIKTRVSDVLLAGFVIGIFCTAFANGDALRYGPVTLPGMTFHDGISDVVQSILYVAAPMLAARRLFQTREQLVDLMKIFIIGALTYIPLIAIELRMSPQLNVWIYGFHQHDFVQAVREGGAYRPMVFVAHGLVVGKYLHEAATCSFALASLRQRVAGMRGAVLGFVLVVVLILCNSLASLIYTVLNNVAMPVLSIRSRLRIVIVLLVIVTVYPVLRLTDTLPVDALTEYAGQYSAERAHSLGYRFDMERGLLERAMERPLFGWGGYARNFVYDTETGDRISVPDGTWILQLGSRGIVGAVTFFGLLFAPVLAAVRRARSSPDPVEQNLMTSAALLLAFTWFDLLPNSGPPTHVLVFAGAVHSVASSARLPEGDRVRQLLRTMLVWRLITARRQSGRVS